MGRRSQTFRFFRPFHDTQTSILFCQVQTVRFFHAALRIVPRGGLATKAPHENSEREFITFAVSGEYFGLNTLVR